MISWSKSRIEINVSMVGDDESMININKSMIEIN